MKCLILGANSDIAYEFSKILYLENYKLILTSRNLENLIKKKKLLEVSNEIIIYKFDITEYDKFDNFFLNLDEDIDLIFIASGYLEKPEINTDKIIDINFNGPKRFINQIISNSNKFSNLSKIICITSIAADRVDYKEQAYTLAKHNLSKFLFEKNIEIKNEKISIKEIKLGYVKTKMTKDLKLSKILTSSSKTVANKIFSNLSNNKKVIYTPFFWRPIVILYNIFISFKNFFKFNK